MIAIARFSRFRFPARRVLAAWLWLCIQGAPIIDALAASPQAQSFEIPELPLKDALARFDALTRMSVFYPSSLVEGRRSHAVLGNLSPREALDALLEGTGVAAQATAHDAFVLAPSGAVGAPSDVSDDVSRAADYPGRLQGTVLQALCAPPSLSPGDYRLAMTIQVGANARITRVRLLDTTGDARRDAAIVRRLQGLDMGVTPADSSRPFVLLMLPTDCGAGQASCAQSPCRAMAEH